MTSEEAPQQGAAAVDALVRLLDLERVEEDLFRGVSPKSRLQRVFGGQVAGQALVAAGRTVEPERHVHSLHSYFIRPGDPQVPIVYSVDRVRDGRSFSVRRVVAVQHGRAIFSLSASFQLQQEGIDHQTEMPEVPAPESLEPLDAQWAGMPPEAARFFRSLPRPMDLRYVDDPPWRQRAKGPREGTSRVWLRADGTLPDDPLLHVCVLTYASDMTLLDSVLVRHGIAPGLDNLSMASLDHAMWFLRPFRADEWLLYVSTSPSASGGRGSRAGGSTRPTAGTLSVSCRRVLSASGVDSDRVGRSDCPRRSERSTSMAAPSVDPTATSPSARGPARQPSTLAWPVIAPPAALMALLLLITSGGYGYERDELYFRMLPLAWGYEDQPPFVPALAHLMRLISPSLTVLRLPSVLFAAATVVVGVLVACELGGDRRAQAIAAWGIAFSGAPLTFAHTLLTATPDMLLWLTALLFATRALLRDPRWWVAAGAAVGLATYVKYLIVLLVLAVVVGLLVAGPRAALRSRWLALGVAVALVVGAPNMIWQATHAWPQVTMTSSISQDKGGSDRVMLLPFQFIIVGPPLVPVWVAGFIALLRRPGWRAIRGLAIAYPVLLALVLLSGGQIYYPLGLLLFLVAVGAVPTADWTRRARSRTRFGWVIAALALTVVVSSVIALPLIPVSTVGRTPIPAVNQAVRDQIGWQQYVAEVRSAYRTVPAAQRATTVVLAENYGEAGAIYRYGSGLPRVYSGHNALYFVARPPASTTTVTAVGFSSSYLAARFATCRRAGTLDNRVGVDNEEQGRLIEICSGPRRPWSELWPSLRHDG